MISNSKRAIESLSRPMKSALKHLLYRPSGISYGRDSFIYRPYVVHGASSIRIGDQTTILGHGYIQAVTEYAGLRYESRISIGNQVYIGRYVYLTAMAEISIGDGCVLSEHVYVTDLMHGFDPRKGLIMEQALECKGPVRIGPSCFLGYRAAVMPGVSLGSHCVVGANSVVTKSFGSYSMLAGSPARLIKTYSPESGRWESAL